MKLMEDVTLILNVIIKKIILFQLKTSFFYEKYFSWILWFCMGQQTTEFLSFWSPPPDPPLIFSVFELRRWPEYQKCSKMFKVFAFFGFESKFLFCKRLWLKTAIGSKKKFQKNAIFSIFDHFWVKFVACVGHKNCSFSFFFGFPEVRTAFFIPSWCF